MDELRITHEQLHELEGEGVYVWFRPEGGYHFADVHGLIFRPIPEGASPWDWPDWRLDLFPGPETAEQRMHAEAALAEPPLFTWHPEQNAEPAP